jgi:hypothetical protein
MTELNTYDEMIECIEHLKNGGELEFQVSEQLRWKKSNQQAPNFGSLKYRPKQKTKIIHGVEVPDISFVPEHGESYCFPDPIDSDFFSEGDFSPNSTIDAHLAHYRLCYPDTKEGRAAAILHDKAMLGIAEGQ